MLKDGPVRPSSSAGSSERKKPTAPLSERLAKKRDGGKRSEETDTSMLPPSNAPSTTTPTLAEKLARKASEERAETEAIYRHELSKLGESLRTESETALASMQSATLDRSRRITDMMARIERRQRRTTLWIGSGVIATALCGLLVLWGASGWTNASLERARTQLDAIRGEIAEESRQLAIIQNQTGGLEVVSDGTGTLYAILPEGSETGYGCGNRNCVKLPPLVPMPRTRPTD